jgi:hypothetical protein
MPERKQSSAKRLTRREARDLDVKISFMEGVVRRDPRFVEALQILGDHYTRRGDFDRSLRVDKQLSRLEPGNPLAFYNLACSHALKGEFELAATALENAIELGYRDFKWLDQDPDLRALREHDLFRDIEAKIRSLKVKIGSS